MENSNVPAVLEKPESCTPKNATFPEGFEEDFCGVMNGFRFARVLLWEHADRIRSGELKELAPFLPHFRFALARRFQNLAQKFSIRESGFSQSFGLREGGSCD